MISRLGLPNGSISSQSVTDAQTRELLVKMNENIVSLAKRVAVLEEAAKQ